MQGCSGLSGFLDHDEFSSIILVKIRSGLEVHKMLKVATPIVAVSHANMHIHHALNTSNTPFGR